MPDAGNRGDDCRDVAGYETLSDVRTLKKFEVA
jgi:hypothetical protein